MTTSDKLAATTNSDSSTTNSGGRGGGNDNKRPVEQDHGIAYGPGATEPLQKTAGGASIQDTGLTGG